MIFSHVLYQLSYLGTACCRAIRKEGQYSVIHGFTTPLTVGRRVERASFVAERTLPFPSDVFRWLLTPALRGVPAALFTAAADRIRRHARQPALPRMSDQWLRTYDADSAHRSEFWRDRW